MEKALSPLDGRYTSKTASLAPYFSEWALMKYRVLVEVEYLIFLSGSKIIGLRKFSSKEMRTLRKLYENFSDKSFGKIKGFEKTTNHDVKSVEYFIKENLKTTTLKDSLEWVHFGLTSEDINNLSYALMLCRGVHKVIFPALQTVGNSLKNFAKSYKNLAMLARTHGQPASPTTLGKEFAVFANRLKKYSNVLKNMKISVKLNGATGNYNALVVAYPKVNWINFSKNFIKHLEKIADTELEANLVTTQIEPHDTYAELSDNFRRINVILLDLSQDIWRYISDGYLAQKPKAGEVGSSTMPHKVNPIDFENAEGNLGLSNALLEFFSHKLPVSRLQRDLSDSTVERAWGEALGHAYVAYLYLEQGLRKISPNKIRIKEDLQNNLEVIAEAIQTVLRRENCPSAYEALKDVTRGKKVTKADFSRLIDSLDVSPKVKKELKKIAPENYTGLASKLAVL